MLLAAAFVTLGTGEVAVRLCWPQPNPFLGHPSYRPDPALGYALAPNYHPDPDSRINRLGMRGPDPLPVRAPGTLRLAFIGDSFMFGGETWESTFPVRTARALEPYTTAPIDVVNAGVAGYSLRHYPTRLRRDVLPLAPDVVVLGIFYGNDINGIESPDPEVVGGDLVPPDADLGRSRQWKRLRDSSHVARLIANGIQMLRLSRAVRAGESPACYDEGTSLAIRAALASARAEPVAGDSLVVELAALFHDESQDRPHTREHDVFRLAAGRPGARQRLESRVRTVLREGGASITEGRLARDVCPLVREMRFEPPIRDRAWFGPDANFIEDLLTSPEVSARFWSAARERLADVVAEARAHDLRLLVVGIPQVAQVDLVWRRRTLDILGLAEPIDWEVPGRWLAATGAELGVPTLDLTPEFARAIESGVELYRRFDGHWSSEGERVAGRATARRLFDLNWTHLGPAPPEIVRARTHAPEVR